MTHDELLDKIINRTELEDCWMALQKVVELHKPELDGLICKECTASESEWYPCDTIQVIKSHLRQMARRQYPCMA